MTGPVQSVGVGAGAGIRRKEARTRGGGAVRASTRVLQLSLELH